MSAEFEIRAAQPGDIDELARLYRWEAELHSRLEPTWSVRPGFDWQAMAAGLIETPRRQVFMAVVEGEAVGFILVCLRGLNSRSERASLPRRVVSWLLNRRRGNTPSIDPGAAMTAPPVGIIEDCFVDEKARRSGVGRMLVEAGVEWLQGHGLQRVQLQVTSGNEGAVRFWQSCGFAIGRHRMDLDLE